ncbi:transposable element Tc1 transposase [Trichonephila clavipes]|nr:transposable element Tc1 transposase [Trichonephila clavipes]
MRLLEDADKNGWTVADFSVMMVPKATAEREDRLIGRIVFSDESRFQLCPDDHRRRVWRRPRQRADAAFAIAYHTGPQPEVMVWCLSHTSLASQISLLWNMIGRRLPLPGNVDDLAQRLEQIWQEIPQETIRSLRAGMAAGLSGSSVSHATQMTECLETGAPLCAVKDLMI